MKHYQVIGLLFKYPSESLKAHALEVEKLIQNDYDAGMINYSDFLAQVLEMPLGKHQEYYVNTFDVQALCHIDVGYTLFGEDLKRGNFLVKLQDEYKQYDIDLENELPDHLPNVLSLLACSTDYEFNNDLVNLILLPAILSMIKDFKSESNIYFKLLKVVKAVLIKDFNIEEISIRIPENKDCVLAGNGCSVNNLSNY